MGRLMLIVLTLVLCLLNAYPPPQIASAASGLTLDQVKAAYGIDKLSQAGMDGRGQTIAVIAESGFLPSDIAEFAKHYHLPPATIQFIGDAQAAQQGGDGEYTMDTEIIDAMAPNATILFALGPSIVSPAVLNGKTPNVLDKVLTDGRASVISVSYDTCELALNPPQEDTMLAVTKRVHDAGISLFHGAGDYGAYRCAGDPGSPDATQLAINFYAASPYVTTLGGTTLTMNGTTYGGETVWSDAPTHKGTGGGLSIRVTLPAYQQPYWLQDKNPNRRRQVPDAAADADGKTGFPMYYTGGKTETGWHNTGGDSATGPLWTGGTALVNQYLAAHLADLPGGPFRLHAPEDLYRLATAYAQKQVDYPPFHDITQGNNLFYKAQPGYDLTTGLGTPDFYNIALDLEQLYRSGAMPSATASPN